MRLQYRSAGGYYFWNI